MKLTFTPQQISEGLNTFEIEEEELTFTCEFIEPKGEDGRNFILTGAALIEGETYHDFQIEIMLSASVENDIEQIINAGWDWFDYIFD